MYSLVALLNTHIILETDTSYGALKLRPDLTQRFPHKMYNLSNFQEIRTSLKSNQYQN